MNRARLRVAVAISTALLALATQGQAAAASVDDQTPPATPVTSVVEAEQLRALASESGTFVGTDGRTYESAPLVVEGLDGELFYGPEFDIACGVGAGYVSSMTAMAKLARTIEKSGRRAIWVAAPSKSSVLSEAIDVAQLPHGRCDRRGLAEQRRLIDGYDDPAFLHLRARLARDTRQVYWRTDPHWTSVGGAVFAKSLARELDRALARRQHYTLGTETRLGLFNIWRGVDVPETVQTAVPRTSVKARTTRRSVEHFESYPQIVVDHSWRSLPSRRTWPGRTLLLGDSMMVFALENMRPIFSRGRYMWVEHSTVEDVVDAIVAADTVVLEVLQTFLPLGQVLVSKSFRREVAKALRHDQR